MPIGIGFNGVSPVSPAYARPLTIGPDAFMSLNTSQDRSGSERELRNLATLSRQYFQANVVLPQGAVISKITLYGWRQGATDVLELHLRRSDFQMEDMTLASIVADWTGGFGSLLTTTISGMPIDNVNKNYSLLATIDPDTTVTDVKLTGVKIDWN